MEIRHIVEIAKHIDVDVRHLVRAIRTDSLKTQTVQQLIDNKILSLNQLKKAGPDVVFSRGIKSSFSKANERLFTNEDYFLRSSTFFIHTNDLNNWLNA